MTKPYCRPNNAGLASTPRAVCIRLARLIESLDREINTWICEGEINEDTRAFRAQLIKRLEAEGWTMSYDGGNKLKVRQPGHKKPFRRHA